MSGFVEHNVNNIYDCVSVRMSRDMILAVNKRRQMLMLEEWLNDWKNKVDDYGELWNMMQEQPKLKNESIK